MLAWWRSRPFYFRKAVWWVMQTTFWTLTLQLIAVSLFAYFAEKSLSVDVKLLTHAGFGSFFAIAMNSSVTIDFFMEGLAPSKEQILRHGAIFAFFPFAFIAISVVIFAAIANGNGKHDLNAFFIQVILILGSLLYGFFSKAMLYQMLENRNG